MQPQNPLVNRRIHQVIIFCLMAIGLALFVGLGGKAVSQINDPSFIYGQPHLAPIQPPVGLTATNNDTLARTVLAMSIQSVPALINSTDVSKDNSRTKQPNTTKSSAKRSSESSMPSSKQHAVDDQND